MSRPVYVPLEGRDAMTTKKIQTTTVERGRHSAAAERMRRSRQRRREGLRYLTIELHETEIDGLVLRGMLLPVMRHDKSAVVEALYAFFDQTLGAAG